MQKYQENKLPLDAIWLDIPYMDNFADFTVDNKTFPNIETLAEAIHTNKQKIIPIIDGGISADNKRDTYYQLATQNRALIESTINSPNKYSNALVSKVWPNKVVFMDWFSRGAYITWRQGLKDLYKKLPFDGLWLDMNEATTFMDGEYNITVVNDTEPSSFEGERCKFTIY